jgi:hypothetical protein
MAYISNISFVVSDSTVSGVPNMIPVDMNSGSKGKYIYPIKHLSSDINEAISGLAFIQNDTSVPGGYTKIDQDLNEGAGGKYNYLCITKRGEIKMTEINFIARDEAVKDSSIDGYFVFPQDLNTGAKKVGNYVYLLYKTNKGKPFN